MKRWASLEDLLEAIRGVALPFDPPVTVASRNLDDDTPLHVAAIWGDVEAIEMLIQAGADVDARGDKGCTPLYFATGQGHVAAARCLREAGASPHIQSEYFEATPADEAMRSGKPELAALFSRLPPEPGGVHPPL